jgi:hypothetical protein
LEGGVAESVPPQMRGVQQLHAALRRAASLGLTTPTTRAALGAAGVDRDAGGASRHFSTPPEATCSDRAAKCVTDACRRAGWRRGPAAAAGLASPGWLCRGMRSSSAAAVAGGDSERLSEADARTYVDALYDERCAACSIVRSGST